MQNTNSEQESHYTKITNHWNASIVQTTPPAPVRVWCMESCQNSRSQIVYLLFGLIYRCSKNEAEKQQCDFKNC